ELRKRDPSQWKKYPDRDGKSIPIFARERYSYYLEITKIIENVPLKGQVNIAMAIYKFQQDVEWPNPGSRWVCLQQLTPRDPFRKYFVGNVLDQDSGEIVGTLTACRISEVLRRATVAIHRVNGVKSFPGDHLPKAKPGEDAKEAWGKDAKEAWKSAFQQAGWSLALETIDGDLEPVGGGNLWTIPELQQALYAVRIRKMVEPATILKAEKRVGKP